MGIPQVAKLVNLGSQQVIILPMAIHLTRDEVQFGQIQPPGWATCLQSRTCFPKESRRWGLN